MLKTREKCTINDVDNDDDWSYGVSHTHQRQ